MVPNVKLQKKLVAKNKILESFDDLVLIRTLQIFINKTSS